VKHTINGRRWTYPCRDGYTWRCAVRRRTCISSLVPVFSIRSFSGLVKRHFFPQFVSVRPARRAIALFPSFVASSALIQRGGRLHINRYSYWHWSAWSP